MRWPTRPRRPGPRRPGARAARHRRPRPAPKRPTAPRPRRVDSTEGHVPGGRHPVVQLAIQPFAGPRLASPPGRSAAPLRDEGVLILASAPSPTTSTGSAGGSTGSRCPRRWPSPTGWARPSPGTTARPSSTTAASPPRGRRPPRGTCCLFAALGAAELAKSHYAWPRIHLAAASPWMPIYGRTPARPSRPHNHEHCTPTLPGPRSHYWIIALLIIAAWPLGVYCTSCRCRPKAQALRAYHKWIGVTVLLLFVPRILWRRHRPPAPLPMPAWQHKVAEAPTTCSTC